jgi:hypothetical protein
LNPGSQIVEGYQPIMPTFKGQVTEEQLMSLVAYIKSLSGVTGGTSTGTTGGASGPGTGGASSNTSANSLIPRRADRGDANSPGSNPNAPAANSNTNR